MTLQRAFDTFNSVVRWISLLGLLLFFACGLLGILDVILPGSPLGLEHFAKDVALH